MDALAFGNLQPNQVQRMDSNTHMPRTINYGVTFERGLQVTFGDRSHLYVSGTASIDQKGEVLYSGNIASQTERTIDNIESLLTTQGASLRDMAYLIVYVHDHRFAQHAVDIINNYFSPEIPCVVLQASICRPSWLVELEGFALINKSDSFPPFL